MTFPIKRGSYNDLSNKPTISYDASTATISFKNFNLKENFGYE